MSLTASDILTSSFHLSKSINKLQPFEPFMLSKVFKETVDNTSSLVKKQVFADTSDVALFVGKQQSEAIPVNKDSRGMIEFEIPRTYESVTFDAEELALFHTAEAGMITNSNAADRQKSQVAWITRHLDKLKTRILRRRELMACQLLSAGKVEVSQANIDWKLDMGFVDTVNLVTLTNTDLWTNAASTPTSQVHAWKKYVKGADMMILGDSAATAYVKNADILAAVHRNNYRIGSVDLTKAFGDSVIYLGSFEGLEVYQYIQTYNVNGTATPMVPTDRAIVLNSKKEFTLERAPLYRIGTNNTAESIMSDILVVGKVNDDRTVLKWSCEQKSTPFISYLDAVMSIKVV